MAGVLIWRKMEVVDIPQVEEVGAENGSFQLVGR